MTRKHSKYLYNIPEIRSASLCNLRDQEAQKGGQISGGDVTTGSVGFAVAENDVVGWTAKTVPFRPTRRCKWQGFELPCMVHPRTPPGKIDYGDLRDFNYVVAAVVNESVAAMARKLKLLYLITPKGKPVINLEISRFGRQNPGRRATLLP